nr:hypothetical protein [Tanacetum cinerariifolium]
PDQERLINLVENDNSDNSSNDSLLEEVDLFISDNSIPPGIENVADDPEGDIRFLEELLIDDSILSHESSDSNFEDNPSNSQPPLEPPDNNFDLETETKAADYGHIKWIEDLVPRTMWIQEPINYDKHALCGVSHWGRKRQQFYGFAVNRESALDVYS